MEAEEKDKGQRRRRKREKRRLQIGRVKPERLALVIFALMVTLGPLAFGAVDQLVQVGLLLFFAAGLWCVPPAVVPRALLFCTDRMPCCTVVAAV